MHCESIIFTKMIDEKTTMAVAVSVSVHVYSDMTADLVFDEMPHCLSKVFAAPQTEQKPDKLELENSTATAVLSIESVDISDTIVISSELQSVLDESKTEEADFMTTNLDSQLFVIVIGDTKSENKALSIASIYTYLEKPGVPCSLFDDIPDNSGEFRRSLISKNMVAQHMLLYFPFDPGSAGGLVFDNVALVFDNSLQLILPCIAPISTDEFGENPMVPIVGKVFDTMSQPCVNTLNPVVKSFQRIDNGSPWDGIETVKKCAPILIAATEFAVEDGNSKLVDQVFDISSLPFFQSWDEQTNARALSTSILGLHCTFDVHICCWVDTGQRLQTRLGAKIAKTLVLAGIKFAIRPNGGKVDLWDLSSYFIFLVSDVGKNRALSSCGLFNISYPNALEPFTYALRTVSNQLCQDDMPMVRTEMHKIMESLLRLLNNTI